MDRTGWDEDDVAFCNWTPLHQLDDRTVRNRRPQFLRRYSVLQSNADLRVGLCCDDVPSLALAVRHPHRAREGIVRMDLDRQWRTGEQQLQQQGRHRSIFSISPLEPQLSHGVTCTVDAAPWLDIADAPGLVHGPYGSVFDGHRLS